MAEYTGLSILIVTYNRVNELRRCLESARSQEPAPDEIIVYDNASTDGTELMMASVFPDVKYVRSDSNLGCPAGRNRGVLETQYSHVLCVDDDGTLQPGAISAVHETLNTYPEAAVIAGLVIDDYHSYSNSGPRAVFSFSGGICCISKNIFIALGGYHEDGLRQGEEGELAYAIYDAGHQVIQQPNLRLDHHVSVSPERWRAVVQSSARQTILTGIKRVPLPLLPLWLVAKQPAQLKRAHSVDSTRAYFHGLVEGVRSTPAALKSRRPSSYRAVVAGTRCFRAPIAIQRPSKR